MKARAELLLIISGSLLLTASAYAGWADPLIVDQITPVDTRAARSWRDSETNGFFYVCADDFVSTETGWISEVRIRGMQDLYPLGAELLIYENVPATATEDAHPGELLFASERLWNADPSDPNLVGWFDVGDGEFRLTLDWNYRFFQQGTPENPVTYWIAIQAYHDVFGLEEFYWNFRDPDAQSGAPAVYSTDGENWEHWSESIMGEVETYTGVLPAGSRPIDMTFQIYGSKLIIDEPRCPNPSFEVETAGYMPTGGWLSGPPYAGMPALWQWRGSGAVNGHGAALIDSPATYWVSDGDWALYLFAYRFDYHYPGDYLEFYQSIDMTETRAIWFDAYIRQNVYSNVAYVDIDGKRRWRTSSTGERLFQVIDLRELTGVHEIAFGLEVTLEYGLIPDGFTFFDNLRPVGPGDADNDLDIDGDDFLIVSDCLNGPGVTPPSGCTGSDFDEDADVDLADIVIFQRNYTGEFAIN